MRLNKPGLECSCREPAVKGQSTMKEIDRERASRVQQQRGVNCVKAGVQREGGVRQSKNDRVLASVTGTMMTEAGRWSLKGILSR